MWFKTNLELNAEVWLSSKKHTNVICNPDTRAGFQLMEIQLFVFHFLVTSVGSQVNGITPVAWKTRHNTSKPYSRLCGRTAAAIKHDHPRQKQQSGFCLSKMAWDISAHPRMNLNKHTPFLLALNVTLNKEFKSEVAYWDCLHTWMQRPEVISLFIHNIIRTPVLL